MINGDITHQSIKDILVEKSLNKKIDLVIATPPCQGMSTAGKKDINDSRNALICHAVDVIKRINPKFIFFENVPQELNTKINIDGTFILIPDYLKSELYNYTFNNQYLLNCADYGVPQLRERAIFLLVRNDIKFSWTFPKMEKRISLREAIGHLPSLDPEISDISFDKQIKIFPNYNEKKLKGLSISKWFYPPAHPYRQVISMMHTPSGKSAFHNSIEYQPKKENGELIKGFKNTYKRQEWEKPAFTITMYNRTISSQNNVHPGRFIGKDKDGSDIYSDPRVLSLYELFIVSSLPLKWNLPYWASENFIRMVIGEGIPPLLTKKIFRNLVNFYHEK